MGKLFDFIGQSVLILMLGLVEVGMASFLFYAFTWPGMFNPPLPFRIFSGFITGCAIIGMSMAVIRIIWYLCEEYRER